MRITWKDGHVTEYGRAMVLCRSSEGEFIAKPNPFREEVEFRFPMAVGGEVRLIVMDLKGHEVLRLSRMAAEGVQTLTWDGRDAEHQSIAAGVYLAVLMTPTGNRTVRLVRTGR